VTYTTPPYPIREEGVRINELREHHDENIEFADLKQLEDTGLKYF